MAIGEIARKVRELYAEVLQVPADSISPDASFIEDLKGDSLSLVSLTVKAEEVFGVIIPQDLYGECTSVNTTARLIERLLRGEVTETQDKKPSAQVTPNIRFEDTPEYKAFAERQAALMQNEAENPYFVCHESPLTDRSLMDGHWVLNFGSYNYVGMSGREEVKAAAKAAIDKYGTSASGSRLLAGEKTLHKELEAAIAEWKHTETALVLVGGHSTNVTIVGNFCGKNDLILYDAIDHNSIMEGLRMSDAESLPFPHNDVRALEALLKLNDIKKLVAKK
jgi:acyl carrier protein